MEHCFRAPVQAFLCLRRIRTEPIFYDVSPARISFHIQCTMYIIQMMIDEREINAERI